MVLFLLFDSGMKVLKLAPAMEGTIRLISRKVGFCDWNRRSSALSSMSFLTLRILGAKVITDCSTNMAKQLEFNGLMKNTGTRQCAQPS